MRSAFAARVSISVLSSTKVLEEWEGGRQAKVGENAAGGLQHMGALRPDLSIAALVKIEMEPNKAEVPFLGFFFLVYDQRSFHTS